jgi:hypothetical protein
MTYTDKQIRSSKRPTDPMERIIASALDDAGIRYVTDGDGNPSGLDFRLESGVEIEVKRFHSDRIGDQMKRAENVIVAQGFDAVMMLAELIRGTRFAVPPMLDARMGEG